MVYTVQQSCVVPIPDLQNENIPAAFVVKAKNSTITEKDIYNAALSKMKHTKLLNLNIWVLNSFAMFTDHFASYKRLQGGVYFVDELPLSSTGKIARREVKQMAIEFYKQRNQWKKP